MKLEFQKMSGAGNDFIVADNRDGGIGDGSALARRICDRHWGVGADGLLLLEKSTVASYKMMYYNADGSYGGMCGNGGRCIASYAVAKGVAGSDHKFEALDHIYHAEVAENGVRLAMKDPSALRLGIMLPVAGKRIEGSFVDTGAPHMVVFAKGVTRKGLEAVDVLALGRAIRTHRRFRPAGTNVNFIEIGSDKFVRMRTYERGVETETLACGTGSIAAAIVASKIAGIRTPITVVARSKSRLMVDFEVKEEGRITNITLTGPTERVFEGEFEIR